MKKDLFQAIADPTRRDILKMIANKSLNIGSVAENFKMSRTAVYKHIKILTEAGLINIRKKGRERYCEARLEKLEEISEWAEQYKKFWRGRFHSLNKYLNEEQLKSRKTGKRKSGNKKEKIRTQ